MFKLFAIFLVALCIIAKVLFSSFPLMLTDSFLQANYSLLATSFT